METIADESAFDPLIDSESPTLGPIKRLGGIAGQFGFQVDVTYPDEPTSRLTFTGNVSGGPIVMITPGNPGGSFVTDPGRFGKFSEEWVRRFFAS